MAEEGGGTEIHAKLVLDDEAKEAAEKLKEGFEGISERVHETQHELAEMAKQALAVAAGFELDRGIESIKELGHEVMNAAEQSEQTEKSIAGLLAMTDKTGKSFEELTVDAKEVHDQLETIGVRAGASGDAVADAFEMIASRSQKSTEELVNLTDKMALAGKILPGGVGQIASAWRDLESGIVRPRNALVQMMVQSHMVQGSMKQVAHHLTEMMQQPGGTEKVFDLAEKAVSKMADTAKNAPLSYSGLIQSLKSIRELAFKEAGEPIIQGLKGPLNDLREYFIKNQRAIEEWAHSAGEKVGEWVKEAAEDMKEGFEYLKNHAEEIENAIKSGVAAAKAMVEFILAHKEEIAMAFGMSKAFQGGMALGKGVSSAMEFGGTLSKVGAGEGAAVAGLEAGGVAASAVALAAFGAAIISVGLAVDQAGKLWRELPSKAQDADAKLRALYEAAYAGQIEWAGRLRDELVVLNPEMAALANNLQALAKTNAEVNKALDANTTRDLAFEDTEAGKGGGAAKFAVQLFMQDLDTAVSTHDKATLEHMAKFLATHQNLVDAMHKAGVDITKEGAYLVGAFENIGQHSMAEEIRGILDKQRKDAAKVGPPVMDFRGSTFNIKQDFRDQDPDRVVAMMRKDLIHSAAARTQSRMSPSFGM
jgi:hypothetical protein